MFKIRSDLKMVLPVPESKVKEKKFVLVSQKVFYCIYCGSMF